MSVTVNINPQILYWAIERAGKTVDELAEKLPKLPKWLTMEAQPTVKQLEQFSKKVHLPFGYLLLSHPPQESIPFPFFRHGNAAPVNKVSLNVYDTILNIQQRQEWLTEYLQQEGHDVLSFVGKYSTNYSLPEIVSDIRDTLGLEANWAQTFRTTEEALRHLIERTEEAGVIVVMNGIVGNSTRRKIEVEECRGFVMVNQVAPFLFINNADAIAGQMFTLVHELAHVWVGKSAGFDANNFLPADDAVELLCDAVAAEFLVAEELFQRRWKENTDFGWLARMFKVSRIVIARRALDLGKISKKEFLEWYNAWKDFLAQRPIGGGDFYNNQPNRVSLRFAGFIERAVRGGQLSYREAYRLTGLHGDTYHNFIKNKLS